MSRAIEFLNKHKSESPSEWRNSAQWRKENESWLKYSRYITMKVMMAMDDQNVTQAVLAERMGCSQQYVSNLLKGSSNMTLETIARLEDALNLDILSSSLTYASGYDVNSMSKPCYLSDQNNSFTYGIQDDDNLK